VTGQTSIKATFVHCSFCKRCYYYKTHAKKTCKSHLCSQHRGTCTVGFVIETLLLQEVCCGCLGSILSNAITEMWVSKSDNWNGFIELKRSQCV